MKLAYIISAHQNTEQLKLLINQLSEKNTDIYIHIDYKSNQLFEDIKKYVENMNNIILIEKRVSVNWSGFSQVEATLNLLEEVKRANKEYDYVSFISGQCYPLKSNRFIQQYLEQNKGKEFIEYNKLNDCDLFRLKCYNFFRESKYIRTLWMRIFDNILRRVQKPFIRRKNLKNLSLYHGSQWWTITYDCSLFILNYLKENPWYINDFKYTLCPDEHFFQILIMNSSYAEKVENNNLRYINWKRPANSPEVIVEKDLEKLQKSNKLIARKFDISIDKDIIRYISQNISDEV